MSGETLQIGLLAFFLGVACGAAAIGWLLSR